MMQQLFNTKPSSLEEEASQPNQAAQPIIIDVAENFSTSALKTIKVAFEIAAALSSEEVNSFHILKALSDSPDVKAVFINLQINKNLFDTTLQNYLKKNSGKIDTVVLTPHLKKMLLLSHQICQKTGSGKVENIHMFFAATCLPESAELTAKLNIDLSKLEEFMNKNTSPSSQSETPSLNRLSEDLTVKYLRTPTNIIGREVELENIIRILIRRERNSVLLVGEHGVGKSALIEDLAQNLNKFSSPALQNAKVKLLDVATLFASPENLNKNGPKIIEEASSSSAKMILIFDKISFLQSQNQAQALTNFLQQLLKNSNISIVLIATPSFFNEYLKNNSLVTNYFEKILIEEPAVETNLEIAKQKALQIESFHDVKFDEAAVNSAVTLAKRYLTSSFLPQKAIDLLEEAAAQATMKKQNSVSENDIKILLSQKTGIPMANLTVSEKEKLTNLEEILGQSVIGQEAAVKAVAQAIRRARAGLKDNKKPIGSFLFLGPTGVGKTELAKTLAKTIYNDEKAFIRLDMSEYSESHTTQRLVGSPPGYVGYEEGGQLTNPILEKPYSLVLLDEIEKAHPKVFDIFLQVLDDGRLTDAQGRTVDFKNTIIIATSNIASDRLFDITPEQLKSFDRKKFFDTILLPELLKYFRPEFINRFDEIVVFNPLTTSELVKIARLKISGLEERLKEKGIKLEISDAKLEKLVKDSYDPSFGARPLERILRDKLENEIAKKLIDGSLLPGSTVKWE